MKCKIGQKFDRNDLKIWLTVNKKAYKTFPSQWEGLGEGIPTPIK
jgi:hypothetical protein